MYNAFSSQVELVDWFVTKIPFSEGIALPFHLDGKGSDNANALVYSVYTGTGGDTYLGSEVLVGTRPAKKLPDDREGPRHFDSLLTPHNSMYMIAGAIIPHAVKPPAEGLIRYAITFFFKMEEPLVTQCLLRWGRIVRKRETYLTLCVCDRCEKVIYKMNEARHALTHSHVKISKKKERTERTEM